MLSPRGDLLASGELALKLNPFALITDHVQYRPVIAPDSTVKHRFALELFFAADAIHFHGILLFCLSPPNTPCMAGICSFSQLARHRTRYI